MEAPCIPHGRIMEVPMNAWCLYGRPTEAPMEATYIYIYIAWKSHTFPREASISITLSWKSHGIPHGKTARPQKSHGSRMGFPMKLAGNSHGRPRH